jgi:hypothetical protein
MDVASDAEAKAHLATVERDGEAILCLVHPDNARSGDMLTGNGWIVLGERDGHDLTAGRVP